MKIINERPDGMSFETYRKERTESNAQIKKYLKGRLYFVSRTIMNMGSELMPNLMKSKPQHNKPFIGRAKDLRPV